MSSALGDTGRVKVARVLHLETLARILHLETLETMSELDDRSKQIHEEFDTWRHWKSKSGECSTLGDTENFSATKK